MSGYRSCVLVYTYALIVSLLVWPLHILAAPPVQFIEGIWLSTDEVAAEETVRIYVALRNSAEADIRGTVTMYADDTVIGSSTVSALPGRLIETWTDWQPEAVGSYDISAVLSSITVHYPSGTEALDESVVIAYSDVTVAPPIELPTPTTESSEGDEGNTATTSTGTSTNMSRAVRDWERFIPVDQPSSTFAQFNQEISAVAERLQQFESSLRERFHGTSSTRSDTEHDANTEDIEIVTDPIPKQATTTTIGSVVFAPVWDFIVRNAQNAAIGIVVAFGWLFQNPILVQILLLLGLLWLIFRTAKWFGER